MERKSLYIQALIISLLGHGLIYFLLSRVPAVALPTVHTPVEIVIKSVSQRAKHQYVVDPHHGKVVQHPDSPARLLSQFNRRVKEEMRAARTGPTQNRPRSWTRSSSGRPHLRPLKLTPQRVLVAQAERKREGIQSSATLDALEAPRAPDIGDSSISDYIPNVKVGRFTALNTNQFTFYTYFLRIHEQLRPRWVMEIRRFSREINPVQSQKIGRTNRTTDIEFVLDKRGYLIKSLIYHPSGVRGLDLAAVKAFEDAAPFLHPPKELIEADGTIRLRYSFYVRWNPAFMATN